MLRNILLLFIFCHCCRSAAQVTPQQADTPGVYRQLEDFSKKHKVTRFMYGLLFKPMTTQQEVSKQEPKGPPPVYYKAFEGKVIRNIDIVTYDPFTTSLTDTQALHQNILYRVGNSLHFKTQRLTIKNLLLFHRNERFDSLRVRESERIIRSQRYVHEVAFAAVLVGEKKDSVDIYIQETDVWSLYPNGGASTTHITIDLNEQNFFGLGHEFRNSYTVNYTNGHNAYTGNYYISNIDNAFVNANLHYSIDERGFTNKSLSVDRPFYSPLARYAGGFAVSSSYRQDLVRQTDSLYVPENVKFTSYDYYAARANKLSRARTENARVTKLITSLRYLRTHFMERPPQDSAHAYSDQNFYLASVGISTRRYFRDQYIFNYGVIEDVPVGKLYNLVGGYQVKEHMERLYFGAQVAWGDYAPMGYFSTSLEYGTFFRNGGAEQGVFNAGLRYFTHVLSLGRWRFRQFVKPQYTVGLNRFPGDVITINNENGLRGFSSSMLTGTQKLVVTLQTQAYAPWNILGFQFGPYFIYSAALLGHTSSPLFTNRVYSHFGFGLLIKNEYLVFRIFQVSVAFYPDIPGVGSGVIKYDPDKTYDIGFRDFDIGRPSTVPYQ